MENEECSENGNRRLEESVLIKNRTTEGAFLILVLHHLHCNNERFRQYFRLTPCTKAT
jgi:hypothetical protein